MSLDKAIEHGKEHRKPYYKGKAIDPACRNHGGDDWATASRLHSSVKRLKSAEDKLKDSEE
jgi:hypothetical protein